MAVFFWRPGSRRSGSGCAACGDANSRLLAFCRELEARPEAEVAPPIAAIAAAIRFTDPSGDCRARCQVGVDPGNSLAASGRNWRPRAKSRSSYRRQAINHLATDQSWKEGGKTHRQQSHEGRNFVARVNDCGQKLGEGPMAKVFHVRAPDSLAVGKMDEAAINRHVEAEVGKVLSQFAQTARPVGVNMVSVSQLAGGGGGWAEWTRACCGSRHLIDEYTEPDSPGNRRGGPRLPPAGGSHRILIYDSDCGHSGRTRCSGHAIVASLFAPPWRVASGAHAPLASRGSRDERLRGHRCSSGEPETDFDPARIQAHVSAAGRWSW